MRPWWCSRSVAKCGTSDARWLALRLAGDLDRLRSQAVNFEILHSRLLSNTGIFEAELANSHGAALRRYVGGRKRRLQERAGRRGTGGLTNREIRHKDCSGKKCTNYIFILLLKTHTLPPLRHCPQRLSLALHRTLRQSTYYHSRSVPLKSQSYTMTEVMHDYTNYLPPEHFLALPRPEAFLGPPPGIVDTTTLAAHDFDVDTRTGFMPPQPPLTRLAEPWQPWEALLADAMSNRMKLGDSPGVTAADESRSAQWRARVRDVSVNQSI